MSNNVAFDEDKEKRSADDEDSRGVTTAEDEVEQQPLKAEKENVKADLNNFLDYIVKSSKSYKSFDIRAHKGFLLHGKPDLGQRVLKYVKLHGKDIVSVFPRDLLDLTPSKCDEAFKRAFWFDPSIVLLIGLEHASSDLEQMIARKIKENPESEALITVIATTAMLAGVSEKLGEIFGVIDIQELADP